MVFYFLGGGYEERRLLQVLTLKVHLEILRLVGLAIIIIEFLCLPCNFCARCVGEGVGFLLHVFVSNSFLVKGHWDLGPSVFCCKWKGEIGKKGKTNRLSILKE